MHVGSRYFQAVNQPTVLDRADARLIPKMPSVALSDLKSVPILLLFARLQDEEGYEGSYSSVKRYMRKKKHGMKQDVAGFLPLAPPKTHGQIDFGELIYYDGMGVSRKALPDLYYITGSKRISVIRRPVTKKETWRTR